MKTDLIYLLEVSLLMAASYVVYLLFLKKETFFGLNRCYLLVSTLLSVLMPFITVTMARDLGEAVSGRNLLDPILVTPGNGGHSTNAHENLLDLIGLVYFSGLAVIATHFIYRLVRLSFMRRQTSTGRNQEIRISEKINNPFSFFNRIYMTASTLQQPESETVILHEKAHIRQCHSIDMVFMEAVKAMFWFNPFIYLMIREIRVMHEFLADEAVLRAGIEPLEYQKILFRYASGSAHHLLVNSFNVSQIKRRIQMMSTNRSNGIAKSKVLIAVPFLMFIWVFFMPGQLTTSLAQEDQMQQQIDKLSQEQQKIQKDMQHEMQRLEMEKQKMEQEKQKMEQEKQKMEQEKLKKEQMKAERSAKKKGGEPDRQPEYKGGNEAMVKYIVSNIRYPEAARKKGLTGTTYVTFVVDKQGNITKAAVKKGFDSECDAEALRVVKSMPAWTPGELKGRPVTAEMTLPVKFRLSTDEKPEPAK